MKKVKYTEKTETTSIEIDIQEIEDLIMQKYGKGLTGKVSIDWDILIDSQTDYTEVNGCTLTSIIQERSEE